MKKIIALVLIFLMSIYLCACVEENQSIEKINTEEVEVELTEEVGIDVTAILLSHKKIQLEVDETFQQEYTLIPENASNYGLVWKSGNSDIAEIDNNGLIRAISSGTTTIVCSAPNGVIDMCEVVVKEPSAIDKLNDEEAKIFNEFLQNIGTFYNAPAARIMSLIGFENSAGEPYTADDVLFTYIQGTNQLGGTVAKYYIGVASIQVPNQDFMSVEIEGITYVEIPSEFLDVGKINAAIKEYWENNIH